jgi:hypothetical protein
MAPASAGGNVAGAGGISGTGRLGAQLPTVNPFIRPPLLPRREFVITTAPQRSCNRFGPEGSREAAKPCVDGAHTPEGRPDSLREAGGRSTQSAKRFAAPGLETGGGKKEKACGPAGPRHGQRRPCHLKKRSKEKNHAAVHRHLARGSGRSRAEARPWAGQRKIFGKILNRC